MSSFVLGTHLNTIVGGDGEIHKPVELDMSKLYTVLEKRVLIWPLNSNYLESAIFNDIKVHAASRWIS